MSANRYLPAAQTVARIIREVLVQRRLEPAISRYVLAETISGACWLFAVLDTTRIQRMEPYVSRETLHQLSTAMRGRKVILSNTTGLRYAVLLSPPPSLPKVIECPPWRKGILQLGHGVNGKQVTARWDEIGHVLVAGMTGSGKSTFLRLLVSQALQEGFALALADPDGRTFPQLAGSAALIAPLGQTISGCQSVIDAVLAEITRRGQLYADAPGFPDSLDAYNAAEGVEPLPRLLVVIDEYNGLAMTTGGPRAGLAQSVTQVAWRGRKFGVTLILSGQDFTKEIAGPVRDQMTTRVCFRVATASTSRVVLGQSGAENLRTPGRAWTVPWGVMQTYRTSLPEARSGDGLTDAERELGKILISDFSGRMSLDALAKLGFSRRQADKLRADWQARGLAEQRKDEDNALCIVEERFTVQTGLTARTDQTGQTTLNDGDEEPDDGEK